MTSQRVGEESEDDDRKLPAVLVDIALTPLRILTTPGAFRVYLRSILLTLAAGLLLTLSGFAYAAFYYNYVPALGVKVPIHLQFSPQSMPYSSLASPVRIDPSLAQTAVLSPNHPHGSARLPPSTLVAGQSYDVVLHICLPRTPENIATGNFMLDVSLRGPAYSPTTKLTADKQNTVTLSNGKVAEILAHESRSAILPYVNPLAQTASMLARAPAQMLGFGKGERECLRVTVMEGVQFQSGWKNVAESVAIEVKSSLGSSMKVYGVNVEVKAVFGGLRYLMYNYRLSSAFIFIAIFFSSSSLTCLLTWTILSLIVSSRKPKATSSAGPRIKREHDTSATSTDAAKAHVDATGTEDETPNLSDTARTFPTFSRQPLLRYESSSSHQEMLKREDNGAENDQRHRGRATEVDEEDDASGEGTNDFAIDDTEGGVWGAERDSGIGTSMESSAGGTGSSREALRRRGIKREME